MEKQWLFHALSMHKSHIIYSTLIFRKYSHNIILLGLPFAPVPPCQNVPRTAQPQLSSFKCCPFKSRRYISFFMEVVSGRFVSHSTWLIWSSWSVFFFTRLGRSVYIFKWNGHMIYATLWVELVYKIQEKNAHTHTHTHAHGKSRKSCWMVSAMCRLLCFNWWINTFFDVCFNSMFSLTLERSWFSKRNRFLFRRNLNIYLQ